MKNLIAILFLVGILLMGPAASIQSQTIDLEFAGSGIWSYISDFEVRGDYAYCAMKHGLLILDISDPSDPRPVSQYYISEGEGSDIKVSGSYAYMACKKAGLIIFDISDIHAPNPVGSYTDVYSAEYVDLFGDYVYVINDFFSFKLLDVSDPANPTAVGLYNEFVTSMPFKVVQRGNFMIAAVSGGLAVFDVSDIANPVLDTIFATNRTTRGMAVVDTLAYLVTDTNFQIVNISNPLDPVLVGIGSAFGRDIEIHGDYAVIASVTQNGQYRGIFVYDISDPAVPDSVGFLNLPAQKLGSNGTVIFASDVTSFLDMIDMSTPSDPVILSSYTTPNGGSYGMRNLVTDGRYAYIAYGYGGLVIADVSDPASPRVVSDDLIPSRTSNIIRDGEYLYVTADAYDEGLYIVNVDNPENPVLTGYYDYQSPQEVVLLGDYAILSGNYGNANIVDISSPAYPTYVSQFRLGGISYGMAVSGNYLYIANALYYLKTVNISDIQNPVVVDSINVGKTVYDALVYKGYLYLSTNAGIYIYDIESDPAAPAQLGSYTINGDCYRMTAYGDYILVSAGLTNGLIILDMSDPLAPVTAGSQTISGTVKGTAVFDHYFYLLDVNGMVIFSGLIPICCTTGGDANFDGRTDIGDCVFLLNLIFKNGLPVNCYESADANGDCSINIGDVVYLIHYLSRGGAAPVCGDCPN